ncbi:MAG: NAD(+)/NADH kinase [bacterium]|nr:NAD(+)/NADH kinase [bacterium]
MKNLGIIVNLKKENAFNIIKELVSWLLNKDCNIFISKEVLTQINIPSNKIQNIEETDIERLEMVIVLGGDGTLLHTVKFLKGRDVPILAINLGKLGFLTEITQDEIYSSLERVFEKQYTINYKIMIEAQVIRNNKKAAVFYALNDAVVNKGSLARLINFELFIQDEYIATYFADGIIVSTPTGSTAYSLSAGGPIVYPSLNALVITPICPHSLTHRPMVLTSENTILIKIASEDEDINLTCDGQEGYSLQNGDCIAITKATRQTLLICSEKRSFFEVLRAKLNWGKRK